MKSRVREVQKDDIKYFALMFSCPGCAAGGPEGYDGLHMLPVNCSMAKTPSWNWNGNLDAPTLSPSILTQGYVRCHCFLTEGIFDFLPDSEHPFSGQKIQIPDLPQWAMDLS